MKLIKIGAAVVNQTPLDWDANRRHIVAAIEAAREQRVSLLCLPEMCIPGYGCEDTFHSPGMQRKALELLAEIVPSCEGMIVSVGLPLMFHKALYNTACLIVDGRIAGFVGKRFLAGDGIHYEPRWFKPWPAGHQAMVEVGGTEYPLGDIHFECGGVKIGFEICEDAWVANRPGSQLALRGVDIILNPSASHFAFDKYRVRKRFVTEGSRAFGVAYVYANLLGCEAGRIIYDGGALIATGGELVACGPRFSYSDFELTTAVLDITANRMRQSRTGSYRPNVDDDAAACVEVDFNYPAREPMNRPVVEPSWEQSDALKEEEFTRAISLGLFDYLRKSRSRGFVVSLSGGADSSGVACLVAHAVELGIADLGLDGFKSRLGYLTELGECEGSRAIVNKLLLCVYQATRNSSATTRNAARAVAEAVAAEFMSLDVDAMVEGYVGMIGDAIGRPLSWAEDDVALQNIQARARGPGVWMLTNLRGALLLATSNRSEAAVGYATMDGDTCGGLSPIAGIDKDFLRQWLRWLESDGVAGLSPLPALAAVNVQAPTAELRPHEANQTDEADLMPYRILDVIEGAAIRDKHTPLEVFLELRSQFADHPAEQLGAWIERFFRLWCRNQWKRERYAPSFHVDDKNLDPRSWCRFPILSGGFERELAELRDYISRQ
jgi:NAD+ synthase (glutamine-hydrolysing)